MKKKTGFKSPIFRLEARKDKATNEVKKHHIPILVDFKFNDTRIIYPIGFRIDFDKWNEKEQRVKRNNFNKDLVSFSVINERIDLIALSLPTAYKKAIEDKVVLSKELFFNVLRNIINPEKITLQNTIQEKSVNYYFQLFIESELKAKNWRDGTKKKIETLKKHLFEYNSNLQFKDITSDFLLNLIKHLTNDLNLNNTTVKKAIVDFKWFLNWATDEKGYNTNLEYKKFKYKFEGTNTSDYQQNIIFLTWDELQHLYNFDFSDNKRLDQIRDAYCFCCFTSLRYSDVTNLKKHNIKIDEAGNYYLDFLTVKTNDKLTITLNKYALAIWNKYKDIELKDNRLFPVPTNQKYNEYLKEVARIAGFKSKETLIEFRGNKRIEQTFEKWELITTHTARKTFIINALNLEIQPDVIRKWTGHKDHKTLELYIKISEDMKEKSMNKFNEI
jgi:site-specific recombinase XerD